MALHLTTLTVIGFTLADYGNIGALPCYRLSPLLLARWQRCPSLVLCRPGTDQSLWRRRWDFLIVFYSVLFSLQGVFIVRNFLILLPVFAYLAGVGFDTLIDRAVKMPVGGPRQAAILATSVALATAFGWNAWQQVAFGRSIAAAQREPLVRQVAEYLARHASVPVALSPCLAADLSATGAPLPANVTEPGRARQYIFRMSELASSNAHLSFWPATRHDTLDWIGPREVNLNYYPTWPGADHAIILKIDAAEHMGVLEALSHPRASDVRNSCPPQPIEPRNQ